MHLKTELICANLRPRLIIYPPDKTRYFCTAAYALYAHQAYQSRHMIKLLEAPQIAKRVAELYDQYGKCSGCDYSKYDGAQRVHLERIEPAIFEKIVGPQFASFYHTMFVEETVVKGHGLRFKTQAQMYSGKLTTACTNTYLN